MKKGTPEPVINSLFDGIGRAIKSQRFQTYLRDTATLEGTISRAGYAKMLEDQAKADLEETGREFAANELRHRGYEVKMMGPQNPGFDLRGDKSGHTLKVEVKSHAREASSVFVTKREREEYDATHSVKGETWELWNVENVAKSSGKLPTIQRIGHIPDSAWKESGYWLDLSQCSQESLK